MKNFMMSIPDLKAGSFKLKLKNESLAPNPKEWNKSFKNKLEDKKTSTKQRNEKVFEKKDDSSSKKLEFDKNNDTIKVNNSNLKDEKKLETEQINSNVSSEEVEEKSDILVDGEVDYNNPDIANLITMIQNIIQNIEPEILQNPDVKQFVAQLESFLANKDFNFKDLQLFTKDILKEFESLKEVLPQELKSVFENIIHVAKNSNENDSLELENNNIFTKEDKKILKKDLKKVQEKENTHVSNDYEVDEQELDPKLNLFVKDKTNILDEESLESKQFQKIQDLISNMSNSNKTKDEEHDILKSINFSSVKIHSGEKIGNLAPLLSEKPVSIIEQIANKSKLMVDKNLTTMEIQLDPENLGRVILKVIMERGDLKAQITTQDEKTKALIEANINDLKESLQNQGINIQQIDISFGNNKEFNQHKNLLESMNYNRKINNVRGITLFDDMSIEESLKNPYLTDDIVNDLG